MVFTAFVEGTTVVLVVTFLALISSHNTSANESINIVVIDYEVFRFVNLGREEDKNLKTMRSAFEKGPTVAKWECGQPKVKPAFTQGVPIENAVPHSWPWAVSILAQREPHRPLEHFWQGSIVAPRWVLSQDMTAFPNSTIIRVGVFNASDPHETGTRDYRPHSAYDCPVCAGGVFCPSLIKLTEDIDFNENVSAVCLADSEADFLGQSSAILHSWSVLLPDDARSIKRPLDRSIFKRTLKSEMLEELPLPDVMKQWNLTVSTDHDGYVFNAPNNAPRYMDIGPAGIVKWSRDRYFLHALLLGSDLTLDLLQVSQCCEWFANVTDGEVKCQN